MSMSWLRALAFVIAIVAVLDPAVTWSRAVRPQVSLIAATADHAQLSDDIAEVFGRRFEVVRGRLDGVAGTVLVGNTLPDDIDLVAGSVVAVTPAPSLIRIVRLNAPRVVGLNARVPVDALVRVAGAPGRAVRLQLRVNGAVVDTGSAQVNADSALAAIRMTYVPAAATTIELTVIARLDGSTAADSATTVADVHDRRFNVLFFEPRLSWSSTFVRRTVEEDPRFAVTSRAVTSRGVSNSSGAAPITLRQSLSDYATVVVGSPDQLTAADVTALVAFMRQRGGRVVLLLDGRVDQDVNRLTGVDRWRSRRLASAGALADSSGFGVLRARELAWPASFPTGATVHAATPDSSHHAVVWSVSVGAGRLFVSGALDAWQYRDPGSSSFDAFWPNAIAQMSAAVPAPVDVSIDKALLHPGQSTTIRVHVLDAAVNGSAEVTGALISGSESTLVRLWPTPDRGSFAGTIVAPSKSGIHHVTVGSGATSIRTGFIVDSIAQLASDDESAVIRSFVSSRGGFAIGQSALSDLPRRLSAAFQPVSRVETWYPMRSAWWIVPFALLLGAEWWWRRRRGLA